MQLTGTRKGIYASLGILMIIALTAAAWTTLARAQESGAEDHEAAAAQSHVSNPAPYDRHPGVAYDGPSGIWVNGTGTATGTPDVAVISLGVESSENTPAEARAKAAQAMNDIITALTRAGVSPDDIRTSRFNISPRYQGVEVEWCDDDAGRTGKDGQAQSSMGCYNAWENRLTGYTVSNQASVKVRRVQDAGAIIDQVTGAAGHLVRIDGISFDIDDPSPFQDTARAEAVADMKRKAQLLADKAGVTLGRLVYINEGPTSFPQALKANLASAGEAMEAYDATTPISGGEMEFTVRVQGVYLIEYQQ